MNPQSAFIRKIIYVVAIVLLLIPLYLIGQPSATGPSKGDPGGLLARMRADEKLSESQFGQVDPTSATMRYTTLGLRGLAACILWEKSNTYKMKKDWVNLAATLNQISKVEPHYVNVWRFQAWNLSYNVSASFDDYRERYRYVLRGVDFLQDGLRHNQNEPMLVWDVGWYISNKIGRADEQKQFRRMFRADEDFRRKQEIEFNITRVADNDNWLVGKEWYKFGEDMVARGADLKKSTPLLFYSHWPMCQMNYSDQLGKDGIFGEVYQRAFATAWADWVLNYGNRPMPGPDPSREIRLNDRESLQAEVSELLKRLEAMSPGLREKIVQERRRQLTKEQQTALETAPMKRTEKQWELASKVEERTEGHR